MTRHFALALALGDVLALGGVLASTLVPSVLASTTPMLLSSTALASASAPASALASSEDSVLATCSCASFHEARLTVQTSGSPSTAPSTLGASASTQTSSSSSSSSSSASSLSSAVGLSGSASGPVPLLPEWGNWAISNSVGARSWMQTALPVSPSSPTPTAPTCQRLPGSSRKRCAASQLPPASLSVSCSSNHRSQTSMRSSSRWSGISGAATGSPFTRLNASLTLQALVASARTTTSMPPGSPVSRTRTPEMSTAPEAGTSAPWKDGALMNRRSASLRAAPACASSSVRYWCSKTLRSSAHSQRASPRPKNF
mmetsp:Transcript_34513/g.80150  ORF Transcript_34513/g.80150 Transcript_34513/m.80150 type:complete len:314 (+) Transcript_34513:894-1835(+)